MRFLRLRHVFRQTQNMCAAGKEPCERNEMSATPPAIKLRRRDRVHRRHQAFNDAELFMNDSAKQFVVQDVFDTMVSELLRSMWLTSTT